MNHSSSETDREGPVLHASSSKIVGLRFFREPSNCLEVWHVFLGVVRELDRVPVLWAFGGLCFGVCAAGWWPLEGPFWSVLLVVVSLISLWFARYQFPSGFVAPLVGVFFASLGFHLGAQALRDGAHFMPSPRPCTVRATVRETASSRPGVQVVKLEQGYNETERQELPAYGRLTLRDNHSRLGPGDQITFRSRILKPENKGNPGEFDWETHCKQERILWLAYIDGKSPLTVIRRGNPFSFGAFLFAFREAVDRFLHEYSGHYLTGLFSEETLDQVKAVHKGLFLGDRGEISRQLRQDFADAGLAHMLAASGLHVAMAAMLAILPTWAICRLWPRILLWVPRQKLLAILAIPFVLGYCCLVGAKIPIVRAAIMGLVVAAAVWTDRRWDSLNSLGLAGLLVVCFSPLSLFTPSFQLSFAAVTGIFLMAIPLMKQIFPPRKELYHPKSGDKETSRLNRWGQKLLKTLVASAVVSCASTVAVIPFLIAHFGSIPVNVIFANIAAACTLTGGFVLGMAACIVGVCFGWLGALFLVPADLCILLVIRVAQFFGNLSWATVKVGRLDIWEWPFLLVLVGTMVWWLRTLRLRAAVGMVLAALALFGVCQLPLALGMVKTDLRVVFLNVGKSDAISVIFPGRRALFIDGGYAGDSFDAGQTTLLPFVLWQGISSLEGIVITHPEMDHMGGFLTLLGNIPVRRVWWNPIQTSSAHLKGILDRAKEQGAEILNADRVVPPLRWGQAEMRFLNPPASMSAHSKVPQRLNDLSVVARLEYGEISFLFTGDLEQSGEEELLASGLPLQATVLKVGHHGSCTSTSARFLDAVQPRIAVISNARESARGGVCRDVLSRLNAKGITVFWTGRDGAITMTTDGKHLRVRTGKNVRHPGGELKLLLEKQ